MGGLTWAMTFTRSSKSRLFRASMGIIIMSTRRSSFRCWSVSRCPMLPMWAMQRLPSS